MWVAWFSSHNDIFDASPNSIKYIIFEQPMNILDKLLSWKFRTLLHQCTNNAVMPSEAAKPRGKWGFEFNLLPGPVHCCMNGDKLLWKLLKVLSFAGHKSSHVSTINLICFASPNTQAIGITEYVWNYKKIAIRISWQ